MFSLVIPIIPRHFRYLSRLLKELSLESVYITEILICASSVNDLELKSLEKILRNAPTCLDIRTFTTSSRRTAGENRNIGWDESKAEFVAFLDADDIYHPLRLSTISRVLLEHGADAVVHNYFRMSPRLIFRFISSTSFGQLSSDELREANGDRFLAFLPDGEIYSGESNLVLPDCLDHASRVHHGHLVIKRTIPFRYSSRKTGEDGELVVEVLKNGFQLVYIDVKLSIYDRINLANVVEAFAGHATVKLSRIYRILLDLKLKK